MEQPVAQFSSETGAKEEGEVRLEIKQNNIVVISNNKREGEINLITATGIIYCLSGS